MKQNVEILQDEFVDYAGKVHKFIIVGVSDVFLDSLDEKELMVCTTEDIVGRVPKCLRLGIAICNPVDEFDYNKGVRKALSRADKNDPALYASKNGYINSPMVKAFLQQEADYLKNNPENYIEGYNEAKERYLRNKSMTDLYNGLSESERNVVEEAKKDSNLIKKLSSYLTWFNNQKIGNAKNK